VRFGECFAGAGGMSLGLERAGLAPAWYCELDRRARAVLRARWPATPLYGDIRELKGRVLVRRHGPIDLLVGGFPCQDLSAAGKRAGLAGSRSSLFFELTRVWEETGAPYLLAENVAGALSSHGGQDFARILSTLVGADLAVPQGGWLRGGVAAGPAAVAAWRVLDLRYMGAGGLGPPQRRVRVFVLAARAGGVDPAEVLALGQGVCRHPDPREAAGEGAAREVGARVAGRLGSHRAGGSRNDLDTAGCYPVQPFTWDRANVTSPTNRTTATPGMSGTLHTEGLRVVQPLCVTGPTTHALTAEGCDASEDGTGRGTPTIVQPWPAVAPTLDARDAKGPGNFHNGELQATIVQERPRRLMPLECERLMGWPDGHTAEGVDERGRRFTLSDSARYRLCGNGVGAPHAEWLGRRLLEVLEADPLSLAA
jgi:DNA (cytosine-5)-methyltransferase 1